MIALGLICALVLILTFLELWILLTLPSWHLIGQKTYNNNFI
jgi:hypothetical protein